MDDVIENNTELDRILETSKFDGFELVNLPLKQPDMLLQELMGFVACTSGVASQKGSNGELCMGVDLARGLPLLFSIE